MTPPDAGLVAQLRAALVALGKRQVDHTARWAELHVLVGRALEAAERGDTKAALAQVELAADIEYAICGDCDSMGKVEGPDADPVGRALDAADDTKEGGTA